MSFDCISLLPPPFELRLLSSDYAMLPFEVVFEHEHATTLPPMPNHIRTAIWKNIQNKRYCIMSTHWIHGQAIHARTHVMTLDRVDLSSRTT